MVAVFATPQEDSKTVQEDPKKDSKKEAAPTINSDLRVRYWRALKDLSVADLQKERASRSMEAVMGDMTRMCGDKYVLSGDANGEPVCILKPLPDPKQTAKK